MIEYVPYIMLGIVAVTLFYVSSDFNFYNKHS